jgi:hypothetical protein
MKSRKPVDFMAGLRAVEEREGVQRRPRPAQASSSATVVPLETERPTPPPGPRRQHSRHGKVSITYWVDPAARKQLAQLALDHDTSQEALCTEALNLLFEKYGRSPIATAS